MTESVLRSEVWIRLASFGCMFLAMATWEVLTPRRPLTTSKPRRWFDNLALAGINTVLLRALFPAASVGLAWMTSERGWGLLNVTKLPFWVEVALAVAALDFIVYLQHVMFHAVPAFWRLHRVHHADLDFDVTTGNRFHPLEIVLSILVKAAAILAIGPPVLAVLAFEVLLNATSTFNHANVGIPRPFDRVLRLFVVTPDMHRVHHSTATAETNSNFGFNLPWWDRLLGTYRAEPKAGHEGMSIGLPQFRDPERLTLARLLALPFVAPR